MPKLLIASSNPGKLREFRHLLDSVGYEIVSPPEAGIAEIPNEKGKTYEENARFKALNGARLSQLTTLADDSGLEVDALGGRPGPESARFAGESATDQERIRLLLAELSGIPWERRTARFKCVIAIATPQGQVRLCYGECQGLIAFAPSGKNGFGYDPIFYLPELGKTMAELPLEIKNQISHRARASQEARLILKQLLV